MKRYIEKQNYFDCQLVALMNAGIALGVKPLSIQSKRYEQFVDLCGARHGAALRLIWLSKYLGLKKKPISNNLTFDLLKKNLPCIVLVHCMGAYDSD